MALPESAYLELTPELSICRIINGMWQVAGHHGLIDPKLAVPEMLQYLDVGFTTWDLADHYGPAEDLVGQFRRLLVQERGELALAQMQAFTKWVPRPGRMTRKVVEQNLKVSLDRMGVVSLDLLQFHWWEYRDPSYLDALKHLADLKTEGKIKNLGLTNFDTEHLQLVIEAGIPILSNQVQCSIIDRRPFMKMAAFCQEHNIVLFAYGTLCGGLLSDRYIGMSELGQSRLSDPSLQKYMMMIHEWGGWRLFQELLLVLKSIAQKHGVSIANIAVRYILEQPIIAGAIVGTRLGISEHIVDNSRIFDFKLDADDYKRIASVVAKSTDLLQSIGDCGDEYR
ncbi:MAG: aldo/keto reductase [Synechococcales bacterium]|nr:aldo/keto reductase [Synechococcales bacterium]